MLKKAKEIKRKNAKKCNLDVTRIFYDPKNSELEKDWDRRPELNIYRLNGLLLDYRIANGKYPENIIMTRHQILRYEDILMKNITTKFNPYFRGVKITLEK